MLFRSPIAVCAARRYWCTHEAERDANMARTPAPRSGAAGVMPEAASGGPHPAPHHHRRARRRQPHTTTKRHAATPLGTNQAEGHDRQGLAAAAQPGTTQKGPRKGGAGMTPAAPLRPPRRQRRPHERKAAGPKTRRLHGRTRELRQPPRPFSAAFCSAPKMPWSTSASVGMPRSASGTSNGAGQPVAASPSVSMTVSVPA